MNMIDSKDAIEKVLKNNEIEGKEIIREARYISMKDTSSKILRYYNMLFK